MINNIQSFSYNIPKTYTKQCAGANDSSKIFCTPIKRPQTSFHGVAETNLLNTPATSLRNNIEAELYNNVAAHLNKENRQLLNKLLKNGTLLSSNSNDNSTVLENLSAICSEPRIQGLDKTIILKETINAIANPFVITQRFGNIPANMQQDVINNENKFIAQEESQKQENGQPLSKPMINKDDLDVTSSSCVAASIEFNLAKNQPAEFARMVKDLTSNKHYVEKTIDIDNISSNLAEAKWLLDEFNVDYKIESLDKVKVKIAPDRNAIIRARIQTVDKDPTERSVVDVLLQSTFMNVGSQKSYNSLTDTRTGKYNPDNKGLTDIEKNIAEVLATGKRKISVTYQNLDDEGKISGYECDFKTMKQQISDALKERENVIIGYTYTDENNIVQGGHEITLIDIVKGQDGKDYFVCNDTDDNKSEPIYYEVETFLPKIHHAGLPKSALKEDVEFVQNWKELLKEYKEFKKAS